MNLRGFKEDFLWGGSDQVRKLHLVSWDKATLSKEKGGLGVRRIGAMNDSLLLKWWRRFAIERDSLSRRVVSDKYDMVIDSWEARYGVA